MSSSVRATPCPCLAHFGDDELHEPDLIARQVEQRVAGDGVAVQRDEQRALLGAFPKCRVGKEANRPPRLGAQLNHLRQRRVSGRRTIEHDASHRGDPKSLCPSHQPHTRKRDCCFRQDREQVHQPSVVRCPIGVGE
jgi:hypothetical protein